jgi:hypothetical protein
VHLDEAVAGNDEALTVEHVVLGGGEDVGNAPLVQHDFDGSVESLELEGGFSFHLLVEAEEGFLHHLARGLFHELGGGHVLLLLVRGDQVLHGNVSGDVGLGRRVLGLLLVVAAAGRKGQRQGRGERYQMPLLHRNPP